MRRLVALFFSLGYFEDHRHCERSPKNVLHEQATSSFELETLSKLGEISVKTYGPSLGWNMMPPWPVVFVKRFHDAGKMFLKQHHVGKRTRAHTHPRGGNKPWELPQHINCDCLPDYEDFTLFSCLFLLLPIFLLFFNFTFYCKHVLLLHRRKKSYLTKRDGVCGKPSACQAPRVGFHRRQLNLNEVLRKRPWKEGICLGLCRQRMSFKKEIDGKTRPTKHATAMMPGREPSSGC